jgi:pimeloyl-ACP methyl ester carboxylesterase
MRRLRLTGAVLLLSALGASACSTALPRAPGLDGTSRAGGPTDLTGTGSFEFAPPGAKAIKVFYAVGSGDRATGRVVVVMHGTNRNARDYRDSWTPLVQDHPWVVIAPEFDQADFPGASGYNLGGTVDESGDPRSARDWTFAYIRPLVDRVRAITGIRDTTFDLFGHSAGAQFVHRYLEFEPEAPVRRAVAANAGWYTTPDLDVDFPYGLGHTPAAVDLDSLFARDLTVLLGSEDVEDENLRQDAGAARQGQTRIERGEAFYQVGSELARRRGIPFRWALRVVPGIAHDHAPMSAEAADIFAQ